MLGVPTFSTLLAAHGKLVVPLLAKPDFSVAHRGGSADWPEMSMKAYSNSVARGVDALEISLARTSDGVWFGLHDKTLDRTSGTVGFVAAEHTWAEVRAHSISAAAFTAPAQSDQPYLRFEDLVRAFARTHTIFVDPKSVRPEYFPELFGMMEAGSAMPAQNFIAKSAADSTSWAAAARERGFLSWGYYYGSMVDADRELLPSTQAAWNLLGMDYAGSEAAWGQALSFGKPVVGHIIPDRAAADIARAKGAAGLMLSGVAEVLKPRRA